MRIQTDSLPTPATGRNCADRHKSFTQTIWAPNKKKNNKMNSSPKGNQLQEEQQCLIQLIFFRFWKGKHNKQSGRKLNE